MWKNSKEKFRKCLGNAKFYITEFLSPSPIDGQLLDVTKFYRQLMDVRDCVLRLKLIIFWRINITKSTQFF